MALWNTLPQALSSLMAESAHGLEVKNTPANQCRRGGLVLGSGRSFAGGHDNPLQYSCLENRMDRGPGGLQSIGLQKSDKNEVT